MRKIWFSAVFGAAMLLGLPGVSSAQRGGGGHGGGGYGHGGYGYGHYGYGRGYGYGGYGYGYGYGFGLYLGYPYYPYESPYYGSTYFYGPPINYVQPPVAPPASFAPEMVPPPSPTEKLNPTIAMFELRVPENAEVWFNGDKTSQTGTLRHYDSPTLQPERTYTYEIRPRWTDAGGKPVDRTKQIKAQAEVRIGVDFNIP